MDYYVIFALELLVLLLAAKFARDLFRFYWRQDGRARRLSLNLSIAVLPLLFTLLLTDLGFHIFYVRSDFFGFTYAAKRWWDTYWVPQNSFQYRDGEFKEEELRQRPLIFLLGDSIAAGQGIDNVQDRFGNQLERKLGIPWKVLNIARCGWSTSEELDAFKLHLKTLTPKFVILSYFANDIEGAGVKNGIPRPQLLPIPQNALGRMIEHSALLDFVYWRIFRLTHPELGVRYWDYIRSLVNNQAVWRSHLDELSEIIAMSTAAQAKLIIILWPNMLDLNSDAFITEPLRQFLQQKEVLILDLHKPMEALPVEERVANSTDHHPGLKVQKIVAEDLAKHIQAP